MKKVVIVGANGQVASEVVMLLHGHPGVDLVSISRTRNGSAFLRSRGIPVFHGAITKAETARAAFAGADLIANFALATGLGRAAVEANHAIIDATIDHSAPDARIVFFSTLAVHGNFDVRGRRYRNAYGDLKLRNEVHFERAIRRARREGLILRLGHVCGDEQNISHHIRSEIERGVVVLQDPEKSSNTTHVYAIVEALLAVLEARAPSTGRFDCINAPTWSWRKVYQFEASKLGRELAIRVETDRFASKPPLVHQAASALIALVGRLGIRAVVDRGLSLLPESIVGRIKARHAIAAARQEIGLLAPRDAGSNPATWWPALPDASLPGVRETRKLIDAGAFGPCSHREPWPPDLN